MSKTTQELKQAIREIAWPEIKRVHRAFLYTKDATEKNSDLLNNRTAVSDGQANATADTIAELAVQAFALFDSTLTPMTTEEIDQVKTPERAKSYQNMGQAFAALVAQVAIDQCQKDKLALVAQEMQVSPGFQALRKKIELAIDDISSPEPEDVVLATAYAGWAETLEYEISHLVWHSGWRPKKTVAVLAAELGGHLRDLGMGTAGNHHLLTQLAERLLADERPERNFAEPG